jgi:hypothetical protein
MANPTGEDIVTEAAKFLGRPYVYGASGPDAFDCSSLVQYVYKQLGLSVPRTSSEQYAAGINILTQYPPGWPTTGDQTDLAIAPGDLIFSEWPGDDVPHHGHVAIYSGRNHLIEAPRPGGVVHEVLLDTDYMSHIDGIVHIPGVGYSDKDQLGSTALANYIVSGAVSQLNQDLGKTVAKAGAAAAGATSSVAGDVLTGIAPIGNFFTSITSDLTGILHVIWMFFQPSTYIRLGAGILGFMLLLGGVYVMARQRG